MSQITCPLFTHVLSASVVESSLLTARTVAHNQGFSGYIFLLQNEVSGQARPHAALSAVLARAGQWPQWHGEGDWGCLALPEGSCQTLAEVPAVGFGPDQGS